MMPNLKLFLCGDVMTGRGVDQILPHPSEPELYEPYITDARHYVDLAREVSGEFRAPVKETYIWGDALDQLDIEAPDLRLINLETSITESGSPWPGKGIHYRMHPGNLATLIEAGVHGCALANNHILDWDYSGLTDTLNALDQAGIGTAGAGHTLREAAEPLVLPLAEGNRLLFVSCAMGSSGVPLSWAATESEAGVFRLTDLSTASIEMIRRCLAPCRKTGDRVVVSIHWGGNWGYEIESAQQTFARSLIDELGVDLVHGHSSHHPRPIEVYNEKLILYGCGDFINDYEGIGGSEAYRGDLALMYFPSLDLSDGYLREMRMIPMQMKQFCLHQVSRADTHWICDTLNRISQPFNAGCELANDGVLQLTWS